MTAPSVPVGVMGAPVRPTPVTRANPVAKLGAALLLTVAVLLSVDVVSAGVALICELCLLPLAGLPPRALLVRSTPLLLAAVPAGVATTVVGVDSGAELVGAGPFTVSEGSALLGAAIALRVLAVGIPGVALVASTDPTDLADALSQRLHAPPRFVLGSLAGLRLVGLLAAEWTSLTLARRARGVGDARGPLGRLRVGGGQAFALLVLALRRGTRLATAMEARGFGSPGRRTWARESTFAARDAGLVLGAALVAALAVGAAVAAGTWSFVLT